MQTTAPDFSRRRFRIDEHSSSAEKEWFHDVFRREVVRADLTPRNDSIFSFETNVRALPGLIESRTRLSPMRGRRYKQPDKDDLHLNVILSGGATFLWNGHENSVLPGSIGYSRSDRSEAVGMMDIRTNTEILALSLSRRLIEPLVNDYENLSRQHLPPGLEAGRLLVDYLDMLDARESITTAEAQRLVVSHVHDLVALVVGSSRDGGELAAARGGQAGRFASVKKHILQNLENPALSVSTVAAQQGVSTRYVHMLFENTGTTFSEFVVGHRLLRAHRMLTDPRHAGRTISDIAYLVGFGDLSYFNRTFRRRFGGSPSDVRAESQRGK